LPIKPASQQQQHSSNQFSLILDTWTIKTVHGARRCRVYIQCGENGIRTKCTHIKYQAGIAISRAREGILRREMCLIKKRIQHKLNTRLISIMRKKERGEKEIKNRNPEFIVSNDCECLIIIVLLL
jgi:hypothetical protein